MKTFFLTGLPRSRTAWFANLLTTDQSFCFHELKTKCSTPGRITELFGRINRQRVGTSDPNPDFIEELIKLFPGSPLVIIERDKDECIAATAKFLGGLDGWALKYIETSFEVLGRLKKLSTCLVEQFHNLDDQAVERIWNYCLPGLKLDELRLAQLQGMKIEMKREGVITWLAG